MTLEHEIRTYLVLVIAHGKLRNFHMACAKEYLQQMRFFFSMLFRFIFQLIRRRYFSNELHAPGPWSVTPREYTILPVETINDGELFKRKS
jgi:hypothetical protein